MADSQPSKHSNNFKDLTGHTFNYLRVIAFAGRRTSNALWRCLCKCGNETIVSGTKLLNQTTKSCGCWKREVCAKIQGTHHMSRSPEYLSWLNAKARCFNPTAKHYESYGGRGITMCKEWRHSFQLFYEHMGECPQGWTLDRINVDGNYEPGNCRWATWRTQKRNRRDTVYATHADQTRSLQEWSELTGINIGTLRSRYYGKSKVPLFAPTRGRR